jgi:hypothetical protein
MYVVYVYFLITCFSHLFLTSHEPLSLSLLHITHAVRSLSRTTSDGQAESKNKNTYISKKTQKETFFFCFVCLLACLSLTFPFAFFRAASITYEENNLRTQTIPIKRTAVKGARGFTQGGENFGTDILCTRKYEERELFWV